MRPLLAVFLLLLAACGGDEAPATYEGAPIIVISIDTLRADHLPAYGYRGIRTPAIDRLRSDGILYTNAWSHCPMTLPSHVSLFTGRLPYEHGVRNNLGYRFDAAKHPTLQATLRDAGYATGAAVSAWVIRGDTGIGQGFDFFDDRMVGKEGVAAGDVARTGEETLQAAVPWISSHASQPFFFFLHLFEPHSPYNGSYDNDIVKADAIVARLFDELRSRGLYDRSTIVLLSDHGEGLGDHGESEHGIFLYREALHIPLIIKLPQNERAGSRVTAPVQLIDVAPTLATLAGRSMPGRNLLAPLPDQHPIYAETLMPRIHFGWSELRSITGARHHFIDAPRVELYDYVVDPGEKKNIASDERRLLATMKEHLEEHRASFAAPAAIDPEEAQKLAALGYLGQTRTTGEGPLPDPKDAIGDLEELRAISAIERGGDLRAAADRYRKLAARNPRFADAWLRLASLQERFGERDAAITSYRQALTATPELASQIAIKVGSLLHDARRLDEAVAHAQLALHSSPGAAHHLLGRIALARRDFATATREASAAAQDPSFRRPAAILQSLILVETGKLEEAMRLLDNVRREAQNTAVRDLELSRGDVFARMDRAAEAEAAFQAEIRSFPQNRDAYSKLAVLYFATGRRENAVRTLEGMVAASPDRATAELAAGVAEAVGESRLASRWRETFSSPVRPNR